VAEDVAGGFVTAEAAQQLYGVALVDGMIDKSATAKLRAKRPETKAFHRHAYVDSLG
jgi:N-methylhydantoinase B